MDQEKTLNEMVDERKKELVRLIEGALHHLAVEKYDVAVSKRRGVDIFNPEIAVFLAKADVDPPLSDKQINFIVSNLEGRDYEVKRRVLKGKRLLLFI